MTRLRILVSGPLAGPSGQGGLTWVGLHWFLGFRRLGHDAWLVEPVPLEGGAALADSPAAARFRDVTATFDLGGRAALVGAGTRESFGAPYEAVRAAARGADLLVNLSGLLAEDELLEAIPRRLYVDLDPVFTQLWHEQGIDMRLEPHTHFATVGLALGTTACSAPSCGRSWIPTLPPVLVEAWPSGGPIVEDAFTTVANWRGYGSIEHEGVFYGQKAHSVRELIDLPRRTRERIVLALGIHPDERRDLEALARHGWELLDPGEAAGDPNRYHRFVQGSKAELGIAKSGYVVSRSGWFSDRSACYLAAGRPVVAQDTGFGERLPTGEGLLTFGGTGEAAAAIEAVRSDYPRHARAARAIAEAHLDATLVLSALLERVAAA